MNCNNNKKQYNKDLLKELPRNVLSRTSEDAFDGREMPLAKDDGEVVQFVGSQDIIFVKNKNGCDKSLCDEATYTIQERMQTINLSSAVATENSEICEEAQNQYKSSGTAGFNLKKQNENEKELVNLDINNKTIVDKNYENKINKKDCSFKAASSTYMIANACKVLSESTNSPYPLEAPHENCINQPCPNACFPHKISVPCATKLIKDTRKTLNQPQIFYKSQSFDLTDVLESNNMNQHLAFQLPEITEASSVEICQSTFATNAKESSDILCTTKSFNTTDSDNYSLKNSDNADSAFESSGTIKSTESIPDTHTQLNNVITQSIEARPIYPNVPYSPYGSPYGSPRTNRRPPLRESRRISIERSGSFLQLNQYKLLDQIGQGSYGLVKLAYSEEDSTHYAMKILSKKRLLRQAALMKRIPKKITSPLDRVYREIAVLKKLDHPNVVKLIEVLDDPLEDSLYMVFELVKLGAVLTIPTEMPLSEDRAWSVFRETVLGLEYLHYQRIIHADLKPGNLLLTELGHVKIADLGVCNEFLGDDATMSNGSTAGTPAFRSPETLVVGNHLYCGKAADIWALGATLYSLIFGNVPFIANSIPLLYEKIKNDLLTFPKNRNVSDELKDCIQCMLSKDPKTRITLPQLKEHNWVNGNGLHLLPSENENCRLVQVSEDDLNSVVRSIAKLDTLILIKTMLKKHSFGNPFFRETHARTSARGGSRLERFVRAGRSNSAPGSYHLGTDRQQSNDKLLPSLCELGSTNHNEEI